MAIIATKKKPRRSVAPRGPVTSVPQPTTGHVTPKPRAAAAAPRPVAAPAPVAPVPEAIKPITPPSLVLPSSTADRATAGEQWTGNLATGNRGLRELGQGLGGLSSIGQFTFDPGGDPRGFGTVGTSQLAIDPNDPNSTMATIGRNLGKNLGFVGDTNENRNTWASGLRLTEEDEQRTTAANARTKATQDYEKARADLIDQITGGAGAYGSFKGSIRGANAADDVATSAANAVAQAQAAAVPPAAAPVPGATGAAAAAASAAAHGGAAKVTQAVRGGWWGEIHRYPDGHVVFVKKMPWAGSA